jgi:ABC-type uncharacterized transport system permease subunit
VPGQAVTATDLDWRLNCLSLPNKFARLAMTLRLRRPTQSALTNPPSTVLPIVVLAFYLAGAAWLAAGVYRARGDAAVGRRMSGLALGVIAVLAHAVVVWRSIVAKPEFAFTLAETASLVGCLVGAIALVWAWQRPRFAGIGAILLVTAGLVAAPTNEGSRTFAVESASWELTAHIVLSVSAYALITIAAAMAVALALLDQRLRKRKPLGWLAILPSVEALEVGTFQALGAGFAMLTLCLFSGFIFIDNMFSQQLSRKTILSCLAWVVFAALLYGRWRFGWRGRTAMRWTLSGFALLSLAYFGSKIVLEMILGKHWG